MRDSKGELFEIIDAWAAATRLDEFFADAEHRALDLPDKQRERTIARHRQARALIGSTNPLERFDARQRSIQPIDRGEPVDRS